MSTEQKTLTFRVKDLGVTTDANGQEFGQIEAYGAIFNNVDDGKDRVLPGAFKRTITNSKDRAISRQKKYLAPMLWQHNTNELIGGWSELSEDATGLLAKGDINLATQRGREYYALAKAGMADQFSIIYDVPAGGAKYDKSGVRDLAELRLFSIDPVTFAMNDATYLVGVKSDTKAATDDDKAAQEARSKKYGIGIKDGGSVTKPSKYSDLSDDDFADPVNYSYPLDTKAHADNAASRFGDPDNRAVYSKAEQAIIDKRIAAAQKKFGEDEDSKMTGKPRQRKDQRRDTRERKTFQEHLNADMCQDLMTDWHDVIIHAFTCAVVDAFSIGDEPESDVSDALDGLKTAVMAWVAQAVECCLPDYLDSQGDTSWSPADYPMQYGDDSKPDYYGCFLYGMSRPMPDMKALKAMMASDATTGGFTTKQVDKLKNASTKAKEAVASHVDTLTSAADDVKSLLTSASNETKAGRTFSATNTQALNDHADALNAAAKSLSKAMGRHMGAVDSVADDLATVLQGSEAAYGTDEGDAGDQQEGKEGKQHNPGDLRAPSRYGSGSGADANRKTRAPQPPSSRSERDTASEDEISAALADLKALRA